VEGKQITLTPKLYTIVFNSVSSIELSVNGIPTTVSGSDGTATTVASNNSALVIGKALGATPEHFDGIIDEPRIWNRALTATEIKNLYLYNAVPQDGLIAEYLFNEASGSTALDTSGNGNDGTITGATYTTDTPLKLRTAI
jgi:hypothetical protein